MEIRDAHEVEHDVTMTKLEETERQSYKYFAVVADLAVVSPGGNTTYVKEFSDKRALRTFIASIEDDHELLFLFKGHRLPFKKSITI